MAFGLRKILLNSAIVFLCVGLLNGCAPAPVPSYQERAHEIQIDQQTALIGFTADEPGLERLDLFLARQGVGYGDRLVVNADPDVLMRLKRRYLPVGLRLLPAPGDIAEGQLTGTFVRVLVTPPACGDWSDEANNSANANAQDWGCSTQANLARMIADPNDLIAGNGGANTFLTEADTFAIEAYRLHAIEVSWGGTVGSQSSE